MHVFVLTNAWITQIEDLPNDFKLVPIVEAIAPTRTTGTFLVIVMYACMYSTTGTELVIVIYVCMHA